MTADELADRLDAKPSGAGWAAKCPGHADRRASLSIGRGDDDRVLLTCHAGCTLDTILAGAGLTRADLRPTRNGHGRAPIVATYDYTDEHGALLSQAVRLAPKDFRQRRPDGAGGWIWSLGDVRRVLYRLPRLRHPTVYVVEGEKDADRLAALGLPATTNAGGASKNPARPKWRDDYTRQLQAAGVRNVVVLPDADAPGRAHAAAVARSCQAAGLSVKVVPLPGLAAKQDVSDWLDAGHTRDALAALVQATPLYDPAAAPDPTTATDDDEREERITRALERERAIREARRRLDAEERGPIVLPPVETLRDRLARPAEATRWRIEGWQPCQTRVLVAAQFKAGKTTLINNLLRCLLDGDAWLGRDRVEPVSGALALFDFEMGETQLDTWLRAQRIRDDDRIIMLALRGRAASFDLLTDATRARWADWLRTAGVRYLVLDCLRPVLDALGLNEHNEAGRFLVAFDRLLTEAGIPEACIVQHMGHIAERSRGDSRLRDWPDVEWRLMRRDEDPASERYITAYGRDVEQPESQLVYHGDTRRLTIAGGSRRDAKAREALAAVLAVLTDVGRALSGREVKAALEDADVSRDAIDAGLALGVRTGALTWHEGARRARLYQPVSGSERKCPPDTASECPAAYRKPDTRTLAEGSDPSVEIRTLKMDRADDLDEF